MKLSFEDGVELEGFVNAWTPDPSVGDLIRWSLGRIAVKRLRQLQATAPDGKHLTLMHALPGDGHVQHIVDWLTADFLAGTDWIDRVDAQGRPLKLMKCGSVEQLLHEADKAMKRRLQGRSRALKEGDESLAAELADGYTVVRLLTPAALDVESDRMRHCVGHGAYDADVEAGRSEIYSLRDPEGRPLVTIEAEADLIERRSFVKGRLVRQNFAASRTLEQVRGPANAKPEPETMHVLKEFLCGFGGWEDLYPNDEMNRRPR